MKPRKPIYGQPCNGCGLCCLMEQCSLSEELFGAQPRCPALVDAGSRFACGLITQPTEYFRPEVAAEAAQACGQMLGVGTYCDAIDTMADRLAAWQMGEL